MKIRINKLIHVFKKRKNREYPGPIMLSSFKLQFMSNSLYYSNNYLFFNLKIKTIAKLWTFFFLLNLMSFKVLFSFNQTWRHIKWIIIIILLCFYSVIYFIHFVNINLLRFLIWFLKFNIYLYEIYILYKNYL